MTTPEYPRTERIARSIRRELAPLLQRIARDRGLGLVTVTAVEVSPDLRHAKVFVTRLGGQGDPAAIVEHLAPELGRCRQQVARAIRMRKAPHLRFCHDPTAAQAAHLAELLRDPPEQGPIDPTGA
jgi:ribosome-binding factor A